MSSPAAALGRLAAELETLPPHAVITAGELAAIVRQVEDLQSSWEHDEYMGDYQ